MYLHVLVEGAGMRELLVTKNTLQWTLLRVSMLVLFQLAVFRKLLAADAADKRLLVVRVAANVMLQCRQFAECRTTCITCVL